MDGYEFSARVIDALASLAWPAALVAAVYMLREKINEVLPSLYVRHGESELGFKRAEELVNQVQEHEVKQFTAATYREPSIATRNLSGLSPTELRIAVEDCAFEMREMQNRFRSDRVLDHFRQENWEDMTKKALEESEKRRTEWQAQLQPKARALRDELKRRIELTEDLDAEHSVKATIDYGMLAGANPLGEAAMYLEQLAGRLPADAPRGPKLVED